MNTHDLDDQSEDYLATIEPSFSIEPDEFLELDLVSQCIDTGEY